MSNSKWSNKEYGFKTLKKNISINKLRKNKRNECTIFTSNIYIEIAFKNH